MELSSEAFHDLRRSIQSLCGLVISDDKAYLVRDRLEPIVRARNLTGFPDLARRLQTATDPRLGDVVIDAITTRETNFFRDSAVFETLRRELLPLLVEHRAASHRPIRIWSAGTSSGQEAYSLAMLAIEYCGTAGRPDVRPGTFSILGTDVSQSALKQAREGTYEVREVARGVSPSQLALHFTPRESRYEVAPAVRKLVEFRPVNLCQPFVGLGPFDLICCRNVMIYFDQETRQRIGQGFASVLREGGWLLLGSAENLYGLSIPLESVRLGETLLYRKQPAPRDDRRSPK